MPESPPLFSDDERFMREAIREAFVARDEGEVPIGAVIVSGSEVIARGHNRREMRLDPTAHAEMEAIRAAVGLFPSWRLENCTLYVTLEPCPMCSGAILLSRIQRVVYGCSDPKAGAARTLYELLTDPRLNHRCELRSGVLQEECRALLTDFFRERRKKQKDSSFKKDCIEVHVEH